jgi:predicted double-glycine peptidase
LRIGPRSIVSFVDRRDALLVRQRRDYSCGAAALATLLTYHWGDPVSESSILATLSSIIPEDELEARFDDGFSLLDLQRVARALGYRAQAFRVNAAALARLAGPVIVFIEPDGYRHFSVLKGVASDRAILADPSLGNVALPLYRFRDWWEGKDGNGVIFVVEPLGLSSETTWRGLLRLEPGDGARPELIDVASMLPGNVLSTSGRLMNLGGIPGP